MIACSDTKALLTDFSDISACQKVLSAELMTAVIGLDDKKKQHIVAKIAEGKVSFRVVKDAIAHAKIYLLENEEHRRVNVGSANLSDWAFSGKQAETIIVFDDDERDNWRPAADIRAEIREQLRKLTPFGVVLENKALEQILEGMGMPLGANSKDEIYVIHTTIIDGRQ